MDLALRVVKAPGARPTIRAAEHGAGAKACHERARAPRRAGRAPHPTTSQQTRRVRAARPHQDRAPASPALPSAARCARDGATRSGKLSMIRFGSGSPVGQPRACRRATRAENTPQCEVCGRKSVSSALEERMSLITNIPNYSWKSAETGQTTNSQLLVSSRKVASPSWSRDHDYSHAFISSATGRLDTARPLPPNTGDRRHRLDRRRTLRSPCRAGACRSRAHP